MSSISFLSTLREFQENGHQGVILPVTESSGAVASYRLTRASDALSQAVRDKALQSLEFMQNRLSNPPDSDLLPGLKTVLKGKKSLKLDKIRAFVAKMKRPSAKKLQPEQKEILRKELRQVCLSSIDSAKKNLTVIENYRKRLVGNEAASGRDVAVALIDGVIKSNPGQFLIEFGAREEIVAIYRPILRQFLLEKFPDLAAVIDQNTPESRLLVQQAKQKLTIEDAKVLNQRMKDALGARSYEMLYDREVEDRYIKQVREKQPYDAYQDYKMRLASKIYPTLQKLKGLLEKGEPLYIVQPGNNDIRNNMHADMVKEVVFDFLKENGLHNPIQVHILGLGGHPTTASFIAHIEVMTAKERYLLLRSRTQDAEMILQALQVAATKLPIEGRVKTTHIFDSDASFTEKLDELFTNDLTREIFDKVGSFNMIVDPSKQKEPIYLFKGVPEAVTHGELMQALGGKAPYELHLEPNSKHTGENVQFFVRDIPQGQKPIVFVLDAFRTGRQVATFSNQMIAQSVAKEQNWSTIVAPLLDVPLATYREGYTEEQLYTEVAANFAELARLISYPVVEGYTDPFPIRVENYDLLAQYYAKMANVSVDEAMRTPLPKVLALTGKEFANFENTILPGHDKAQHRGQLSQFYRRQQARKLLMREGSPGFEKAVEGQVKKIRSGEINPSSLVPLSKVPQRIRSKVILKKS